MGDGKASFADRVSASIGVASAGDGETTAEQLVHDADIAMYATRRQRSPSIGGLDPRYGDRMEDALSGAADRGELQLQYQPIVSSGDGNVIDFEALVRWASPEHGLISPGVLIPLADRCGLGSEVGAWVLGRAWTDHERWMPEDGTLSMSVNVSADELMSVGFVNTVDSALSGAAFDSSLLTLEISERAFLRDSERALIVLNDLKGIGVTLALDNFGTGVSSLRQVQRYPLDIVKLDRHVIAALHRDAATRAIVTAVAGLAHSLGMTVVADGIEIVEQHHHVTRLGCDACQGFYFARPMLASSLANLIQTHPDTRDIRLPITQP